MTRATPQRARIVHVPISAQTQTLTLQPTESAMARPPLASVRRAAIATVKAQENVTEMPQGPRQTLCAIQAPASDHQRLQLGCAARQILPPLVGVRAWLVTVREKSRALNLSRTPHDCSGQRLWLQGRLLPCWTVAVASQALPRARFGRFLACPGRQKLPALWPLPPAEVAGMSVQVQVETGSTRPP